MATLEDISNIEIDNKPPAPVQNINKPSVNRWNISCEHFRYKRCILVLICIILITIIITVPTVLVHKRRRTTTSTTTTTATAITATATGATIRTTTEVPLYFTNTTKWKQNGITIFSQDDYDEFRFDLNPMYMDNNEAIYLGEISKHRVIKIKLNAMNFSIVADANDTDHLRAPTDIIVDKKTDSIIICDQGLRQIIRWSRKNVTHRDIMISEINCNGLAMDDKGSLYVSDWLKVNVSHWELGVNNKSFVVAGGNGNGNNFEQLNQPHFLFVDKDYSLYVVDKSNHRVMKWEKNATKGIVVAGGNRAGTNLTQLSSPSGIVVDHLGNIYVTDTNNHRVMRWIHGAREGSIVVGGNGTGNETNQLDSPSDLVFDKHGNLYVFDTVNQRIQKFCIESN
ncbi:unnamed protein product [Adineta steineri]|uniref:NHL repeat containing protein-like protein n=1 Tax=Adineta steineri TaxID=433720 RepID=A0A813SD71_9BILA|nr:unnamed protein product [Adineta steineri]CAF0794921.1 unnamed protein product [Adineta steineri]